LAAPVRFWLLFDFEARLVSAARELPFFLFLIFLLRLPALDAKCHTFFAFWFLNSV
jgi:hypothetical protein